MSKRNNHLFLFAFCLISCFNPAFALRVDIGLFDSVNRSYISSSKDYKIYSLKPDLSIDSKLMENPAKKDTLIRYAKKVSDKLVIAAEPNLASSSQDLLLTCHEKDIESDCIWTVKENLFVRNAKKYRGAILISIRDDGFTVINRVELEDYLKGVVPSEMPSSWHKEALKAQSVAARTYTISKLGRRSKLGYDLKPSVEDQVYLGFNHEAPSTNEAIKETEGLVLLDKQKKPVEAFFYSQAGFATASAADVWGIEHHAYLRPQIMADNNSFWQKNFSLDELGEKLKDLNLDDICAVTILNTTPEARVKDVLISGNKSGTLKHLKLTGEELRHKLGLRSTFFNTSVYQNQKAQIGFIGKGFGHGVGMSQYGAKKLAAQGKNFKEILEFFYPGSSYLKI